MEKTYLQVIVENSKEAKEQWKKFAENKDIDDFKKKFHLRPTKSGATIVSTLQERPMRGKKVGRTVVKDKLEELYTLIMSAESQEEKLQRLTQFGFQERKKSSSKEKEENYQAKMIANMSHNQSLKDFLKVDELIFVASEFIIHGQLDTSDKERMDIIGYDGKNRLFFFELKDPLDPKGDPIEQLKKYIYKYGGKKRKKMLKLLKEYPINSVTSKDIVIEGYAVYAYGEKVDIKASKKEEMYKGSIIKVIKFKD